MTERKAEPDSTAVRTALWRALHLLVDDKPHVIEDEIGLKLIAPPADWTERPDMKFTKRIRASIVARSRFIEDLISMHCEQGACQYVILGSGLDTFAQRKPEIASKLNIFEIDQPSTLQWKQQRMKELGYPLPDYLHYIPVDFETTSWHDELLKNGFDKEKPTVIVSTGVTLYLTKEAITSMLQQMATFAKGSTLAITFYLPLDLIDEEDRPLMEMSIKGAQASGTPMISFFSPAEILEFAHEAGFRDAKTKSTKEMEKLYFMNRTDGLLPASGEVFLVART